MFYAGKLGLTAGQLNNFCRTYHFSGAKAVIDRFIILYAKMLLQDSSLLIKEVAIRTFTG